MKVKENTLKTVNTNYKTEEAGSLILKSIKEEINFYKLKNLSAWESNHSFNNFEYEQKINSLVEKMNQVQKMIQKAKETNSQLTITGNFKLATSNNESFKYDIAS